MKMVTRMLEDELFEASNVYGNTVSIDMRKSPYKQGQSPVELLVSSLAACGAVDIVMMLKKRRKSIQAFTIETEAKRANGTPRLLTHIHCKYCITSTDVTAEELHKIAKLSLEKYCSVGATLKSEITFSVDITRPT